jgi:hypothetical protein
MHYPLSISSPFTPWVRLLPRTALCAVFTEPEPTEIGA